MSIFDKLKQEAISAANKKLQSLGNQKENFIFTVLPESLAQMKELPEAALDTPFRTAALTVCALCAYAAEPEIGVEMLNWLRGPRPLGGHELSFLKDRFREKKHYIPFSYFKGAVPENNYTPEEPFTLTLYTNPYSDDNEGYMKLFIDSGGADNARSIILRMRGDGKWFLWEEFLLSDIRPPRSADPWA